MGQIDNLLERYRRHISLPWPTNIISGAQRVIMLVYDKKLERTMREKLPEFCAATIQAEHNWVELDLSGAFAEWMAVQDYRDEYFRSPADLHLKVTGEFPDFVASKLRETLTSPGVLKSTVVAAFGLGALFGFVRVSQILELVERNICGRLVLFFPGIYDKRNYRLLDARDGFNYLAVPITSHGEGGAV